MSCKRKHDEESESGDSPVEEQQIKKSKPKQKSDKQDDDIASSEPSWGPPVANARRIKKPPVRVGFDSNQAPAIPVRKTKSVLMKPVFKKGKKTNSDKAPTGVRTSCNASTELQNS